MKVNKQNIKKVILSVILCISAELAGYCDNVPIPGYNNQNWDNFNINNTFINTLPAQEKQEPKPINIKQYELKNLGQPTSNNEDTQNSNTTDTQTFTQPSIPVYENSNIQPSLNIPKIQETLEQEIKTEEITFPKTQDKSDVQTQDKVDAITDIRNQAKLLYNANKPEEAQRAFQQIADAEKISDDWLYLANIAQDNGKNLDAVFYLKKAIQADNKNYKAHYNLGNLYFADDKINMAIDEYNKAISAKKDFSYAYYNKGCAYLKKNNLYNAKYEFGMAIKNNPNEPSFFYNLAYTYKLMKKEKKAKETLDMYEKLMQQ